MMRILLLLPFVAGCAIDTVPLPEATGGDNARSGGDHAWNGGGDFDTGIGGDADDDPPPSGDCLAAPGTTGDVTVFRFEAAEIVVSIARRYVSAGVGESSIYDVDEMRVATAAGCVVIVAANDLEYQNSHHNWRDRAIGIADGVRYELRLDFQVGMDGWEQILVATDVATSATVIAETPMITTGGPLFCWGCPSHLPVLINEACTANDSLLADGAGDFDTWVELFNPSSGDVDLTDYSLVSGASAWTFEASTVILRHDYMLVWLDGEIGEGALHADFALTSGGSLMLVGPDGTSPGERTMTATADDESLVYDAATDGFVTSDTPSPGASNPDGF